MLKEERLIQLYQTSAFNNDLKKQDKNIVNKAYKKYVKYFHDTGIQEEIPKSKEVKYLSRFLIDFLNK